MVTNPKAFEVSFLRIFCWTWLTSNHDVVTGRLWDSQTATLNLMKKTSLSFPPTTTNKKTQTIPNLGQKNPWRYNIYILSIASSG